MGSRTTRGASRPVDGPPGEPAPGDPPEQAETAAATGEGSGSVAPGPSNLQRPHSYRGRLITVEGIDGSGKSTQLQLLEQWLINRGYRVFFTEWNSSALVRRSLRRGKKKDLLTPTTFSVLHAVDFADRLTFKIIPPLKAGMTVLADRYVYTAFGPDVPRGVDHGWVRALS